MMISTRGRYALRMMLDLALYQGEGYVSLKDISQRQDISKKYLEQLVPDLCRAYFLQSVRGSTGGYRLSRKPCEYTVGEIIRTAEGSTAPVTCLREGADTCPYCADCMTLPVWQGLQNVADAYLDGITLQDVLSKNIK